MKDMERRIQHLEEQHRRSALTEHLIPVLITPWFVDEDACNTWMAAALACHCQPNCPGRRVGGVLPAKLSPEEWTMRAQQYYAQRRNSDA
jgi:hypothetical protein